MAEDGGLQIAYSIFYHNFSRGKKYLTLVDILVTLEDLRDLTES